MKIDILSDTHFDFYFQNGNYKKENVVEFFKKIIDINNIGNVLVIAGDLGHYNDQNIRMLKILKEFYKNIVCVLGNHDYYLIGKENKAQFEDSFERVENMRELINQEAGMYCLDGWVVEIEGVKFGGCDGWYNDGYFGRQYPNGDFPRKSTNQQWKNCMNDANFIVGIENFDDIFEIERPKLERVYQKCDVMITHINPSAKDEHISEKHRRNSSNVFFCFDGEKYLRNGTMKHWIFGHTHDELEYKEHDVNCICYPMGYPSESGNGQWIKVRQIEV